MIFNPSVAPSIVSFFRKISLLSSFFLGAHPRPAALLVAILVASFPRLQVDEASPILGFFFGLPPHGTFEERAPRHSGP